MLFFTPDIGQIVGHTHILFDTNIWRIFADETNAKLLIFLSETRRIAGDDRYRS